MKKLHIIAAFLMILPFASKAQDNAQLDYFTNKITTLTNQVDSLTKLSKAWEVRATGLRDTVEMQKTEIASLRADMAASQESANTLSDSIASLNQQIKDFSKEKAKFDNVRARYANGRLQLPYDKESVDQALILFSEIQDPELKERFKSIPTCLRDYSGAIEKVRATLSSLQNSRQNYNKVTNADWQARALDILNNDAYTRMAGTYENNVSIYYLDNILKEARARINKSDNPKTVTFEDLIIHLNP